MNGNDFSIGAVMSAYYKKYRSGYILNMKGRPHHGLTLVLSGSLKMTFENGLEYVAKENDIILQRKGDVYRLESVDCDYSEYIVVSYVTNESDESIENLPEDRIFSPEHKRRYRDAFERAAHVFASSGICYEPLLRALVQEILCYIIRENYPRSLSNADSPAAFAKYYIEEYYDRSITSSDIASVAGCSASHLRMLFKSAYGESPIHYLNRIRVEHAKEMLASNLFRLDEIATACGFQNVYYFSRVFKEYTGVSPGKY